MRAPSLYVLAALTLALGVAWSGASPRVVEAGPGARRVPEVVGLSAAAAEAELLAGGFSADRKDAPADAVGPVGTVAQQSPGGFAFAETSVRVTIYVRGGAGGTTAPPSVPPSVPPSIPPMPGTPDAKVPDVWGKTELEAIGLLAGWRITILTVDSVPENEGRVTHQTPAPGTRLAPDGVVEISVGRTGTPPAPAGTSIVPSVLGLTEEAANQKLTAARLVPLVQPAATSDPTKAGTIVAQEPAAGTVVAKDSNVVVTVARVAASALNEAEVPDTRRLTEGMARRRLLDSGFAVFVKDRLSSAAENATVLEQDPAPMTRLLKGRTVTLTVGRLLMLPVAVPEVVNAEASAAERTLRDAGFEVERALAEAPPSYAGRVVAQEPPGGSTHVRGSFVRITVGRSNTSAPTTVAVPNLVGRLEIQVRAELQASGFGVRMHLVPGAPAEAGRVRSQSPAPGTPVAPGSEIALDVVQAESSEPDVPLPNYTNMDAATAQADLQAKGLRVALAYATGSPEGRVIMQQPVAGSVTARGALVTLTIAMAPSLDVPGLIEPDNAVALPRNHGVVFRWGPVANAEDYQIEVMSWKDDAWQRENQHEFPVTFMKVGKTLAGLYQWHVRARRAGGTVVGPWSEWRRLRVY